MRYTQYEFLALIGVAYLADKTADYAHTVRWADPVTGLNYYAEITKETPADPINCVIDVYETTIRKNVRTDTRTRLCYIEGLPIDELYDVTTFELHGDAVTASPAAACAFYHAVMLEIGGRRVPDLAALAAEILPA